MKINENNITSILETHYEIVQTIALNEANFSVLSDIRESKGQGGLYEIAEKWTLEFESINNGRIWDGEFFDEIDKFIMDKLK